MSIIETIKNTIKYNSSTEKWLQTTSEGAGIHSYRPIEDSEITLELYYFVGTGDNFERDGDRENLKNSSQNSNYPLDFGDSYDFDGFYGNTLMTFEDAQWIMDNYTTFLSHVPKNPDDQNLLQETACNYLWSPFYGLMKLLDNYNWAKENVEGGIVNPEQKQFALDYINLKGNFPNSKLNSETQTLRDLNFNTSKNLIKTEQDIGVIIPELEGTYSYEFFIKHASIAMAIILDNGQQTLGALDDGTYHFTDSDIELIEGASLTYGTDENIRIASLSLEDPTNNYGGGIDPSSTSTLVSPYGGLWNYVFSEGTNLRPFARIHSGYKDVVGTEEFDNPWQVKHKIAIMLEGHSEPEGKKDAIIKLPEAKFLTTKNESIDYALENGNSIKLQGTNDGGTFNFSPGVLSSRDSSENAKNILSYQDELYDRLKKPYDLSELTLDMYVRLCSSIIYEIENKPLDLSNSDDLTTIEDLFNRNCLHSGAWFAKLLIVNFINNVKGEIYDVLFDFAANWTIESDPSELTEAKDLALSKLIQQNSELGDASYEGEEVSDEVKQMRQESLAQCALLVNLEQSAIKFSEFLNEDIAQTDVKKKSSVHNEVVLTTDNTKQKNKFYNGRVLGVKTNEAHTTISRLFASRGTNLQSFIQMTPDVQACLVPKIEIYKIYRNKKGEKVTAIIPFHKISRNEKGESYTATRVSKLMKESNTFFRGGAVGLKDFNFTFDGETPATAEKFIQADVSLIVQDFRDMVIERKTKAKVGKDGTLKDVTFKYIDLIVNSDGTTNTNEFRASNYVLRVDVGWNIGSTSTLQAIINSSYAGINYDDLVNAIKLQNRSFTLCALDHDLNITDNGKIEIKINYRGYAETLLGSPRYDILSTTKEQKSFDEEIKILRDKRDSGNCSIRTEQKVEQAIRIKLKNKRDKLAQSIMRRLTKNKSIRTVKLTNQSEVETFKKQGSFNKPPQIEITKQIPPQLEDGQETFFYFKDLLYVLLDVMHDEDSKLKNDNDDFKMILADFSFTPIPLEEDEKAKIVNINLGQLPITVRFFKEFIAEFVIDKDRDNYPFFDFINDFLNELCTDFLSENCFANRTDKSIQFKIFNQNVLKTEIELLEEIIINDPDNKSHYNCDEDDSFFPLITPASETEMVAHNEISNVNVIYADYKPAYHSGKGDIIEDLNKGIPHLYFGAKAGLVKNISFSKTNIQYLRESRMERSKGMGDLAQLSNVYNVSIKMFGNFLFLPGMEIYINPKSLGGNEFGDPIKPIIDNGKINYSKLMGIGGYHLVTKVNTSIGVSGFDTTVDAIFIFTGDENGTSEGIDGGLSVNSAVDPPSVSDPNSENNQSTSVTCRELITTPV